MSKASVLPFALKTQAFTQKLAYLLEVLLWCFCCKREKKKRRNLKKMNFMNCDLVEVKVMRQLNFYGMMLH